MTQSINCCDGLKTALIIFLQLFLVFFLDKTVFELVFLLLQCDSAWKLLMKLLFE